jgi:hypothetical protein
MEVKVGISPLSPLTPDLFPLQDVLYELDITSEFLFLQARGTEGTVKDAEDIIPLKRL